jgi:hypothetical protein
MTVQSADSAKLHIAVRRLAARPIACSADAARRLSAVKPFELLDQSSADFIANDAVEVAGMRLQARKILLDEFLLGLNAFHEQPELHRFVVHV